MCGKGIWWQGTVEGGGFCDDPLLLPYDWVGCGVYKPGDYL